MKSFAAAAALAASASAFDAMAVPDFVAGFMYGLTGVNHLTEIEACYTGGQQVVTDTQAAIADFTSGDYVKGLVDAGKVWNEVGSAMTTCQGMDEDIAAIQQWATIFTQPAELSKTVAKNWLLHGRTIKADLAKEQEDWAAGDYFGAGVDTAMALTEAVGPIETANSAENFEALAPVKFMAGLMEGLVGANHLTEMATCATDAELVAEDVSELVKYLKDGSIFKAADYVKKTNADFHTSLTACESMQGDLAEVAAWAQIFTEPKTLTATITRHFILHRQKIEGDISAIETDWNAGQYYKSGQDAADLLMVAIGPMEQPANEEMPQLDLLALPKLAAGFVYGMVGDNNLEEMETCYAGVTPLWGYLDAAIKDLEAFHILSALEQLELFVYHFQLDMAPCTHMQEDMAEIEAWAQIFTQPTQLASEATKHYLLHKRAITADIETIKADWAAKQFFQTGKVTADLVSTLLPME